MKKIQIICIGDYKEQYLKDAEKEYLKRIQKYYDVQVTTVSEYTVVNNPNQEQILQKKQREALEIEKHLKGYVIALCIDGKSWDSKKFAHHLDKILDDKSQITFIIGGSDGLSDKIVEKSNEKLSFSAFTFPHQLMRVILLEQIYRAGTIISGKTYHK